MTELTRRALLGDRQAQEECTAKGIVLPCPKCFSDGVKIEGDGYNIYDPDTLGYVDSTPDSIIYITCDSCNLTSSCIEIKEGEEYEEAEKRLIADWNTRPAPPIGRCGECANKGMCCHHKGNCGGQFDEYDFCNYFEPREE